MIKATGMFNGRRCVVLGLSFGNLKKFRDEPMDTFIKIDGEQIGLNKDIILFSGRTEDEMAGLLMKALTGDAAIYDDKGNEL